MLHSTSGQACATYIPQAARARWRRAHATAAAFVQQLDAAAAAEQFEEAAALQVGCSAGMNDTVAHCLK
jgi:hypothetical protein